MKRKRFDRPARPHAGMPGHGVKRQGRPAGRPRPLRPTKYERSSWKNRAIAQTGQDAVACIPEGQFTVTR
jgi:hypothetical protein